MNRSRPDFRLIEDMWKRGHILEEDYKHCFSCNERPSCEGLHPHEYVPGEMKRSGKLQTVLSSPNREKRYVRGSAANGCCVSG